MRKLALTARSVEEGDKCWSPKHVSPRQDGPAQQLQTRLQMQHEEYRILQQKNDKLIYTNEKLQIVNCKLTESLLQCQRNYQALDSSCTLLKANLETAFAQKLRIESSLKEAMTRHPKELQLQETRYAKLLCQTTESTNTLEAQLAELGFKLQEWELEKKNARKEQQKILQTLQQKRHSDNVKQLMKEYRRKIKHLKGDRDKLQAKCKALRKKHPQYDRLEREVIGYVQRIASLQKLTQKQQQELMATIQAYDGELDRVSEEYKGQVQSCEAEVALLNEKIKEQEEKQQKLQFQNQKLARENTNLKEQCAQQRTKRSMVMVRRVIDWVIGQTIAGKSKQGQSHEDILLEPERKQLSIHHTPHSLPISVQLSLHHSVLCPSQPRLSKAQSRQVPITIRYSQAIPSASYCTPQHRMVTSRN